MDTLTMCEEPAILNLILLIKSLIEIIGIVVPIILIVMVTIDLVKIVMDTSEKTIKSSSKSMLNRIIATIIIFFVPTIVNLVMNKIDEGNVESSTCWTNANSETIAIKTKEKEAQRLAFQKEKEETIAKNNAIREQKEAERKENVKNNSGGGTSLLETALGEVKNFSGRNKYWNFFPGGGDGHWCAVFAYWVISHTSVTGNANDCPGTKGGSSKCYYNSKINEYSAAVWPYALWMAQHNRFYHSEYWAKATGTYKNNGKIYEPQPGDFVFFNGTEEGGGVYLGDPLKCQSRLGHIAFVKEVKNGQLIYVGGNQDGYGNPSYPNSRVTIKSVDIDDSYIVGYGTWPK